MLENRQVYAVILAGGSGTRFWPKSRHLTPKQLCSIGDESETMLETTLKRLDGFIPVERRLIVTHTAQIEKTKKIAGEHCRYYLAEPEARNTANALALAALDIENRHQGDEPAIMISLHADHMIRDVAAFSQIDRGWYHPGSGRPAELSRDRADPCRNRLRLH